MSYTAPKLFEKAFTCPFCNVYAKMEWNYLNYQDVIWRGKCDHCHQKMYWKVKYTPAQADNSIRNGTEIQSEKYEPKILFPLTSLAPTANTDLPEDCKKDYDEARSIVSYSPKGASALLRLIIQKLCKHFGEPGKNINDDIASLVRKGKLNPAVQRALDIVRIVGNSAVHPGEIQLDDDDELVLQLFGLINYIVDEMITMPNKRDAMFFALPAGAQAAIEKRDIAK
jgi:hypothetical protein